MNVVFFDFDGTLTRRDTFIEFAKFSRGKKRFILAGIKFIPYMILWKLGLKTNSEAKERLFYYLYKGMQYSEFTVCCGKFANFINRDIRPEIKDVLIWHKQQRHRIFIVSASIADWISPWAIANGIEKVIATEIDVNPSGVITGTFKTPNCHGLEKVRRIRVALPDISSYESWGYGDSSGDDAMLAMVNHPNRV